MHRFFITWVLVFCCVLIFAAFPASAEEKMARSKEEYYGRDYMNCLKFARAQTSQMPEAMRESAMGEMLNECMYTKGWANFTPREEAAPQAPAAPRPVAVAPAVRQAQPAQQGASAAGFYGQDYMNCLQTARHRSQFVHASMREQAIGELLNECMYSRGHAQYAPIDGGTSETDKMLLFYSY